MNQTKYKFPSTFDPLFAHEPKKNYEETRAYTQGMLEAEQQIVDQMTARMEAARIQRASIAEVAIGGALEMNKTV